jgi:hypothetical protein
MYFTQLSLPQTNITNQTFSFSIINNQINYENKYQIINSFIQTTITTNNNNRKNEDDDDNLISIYIRIPFMIIALLVILQGLVGNTLVCLAINLDVTLRSNTNRYLISLAIVDLLVTLIVMPLSIINIIYSEF